MELLSPSFSVYIPASKYLKYNVINMFLTIKQGTQCTGKTGKMAKKNPRQGKQGIWKFCRKRGIWFVQIVNSLIVKVKYTSIFATKIFIYFKSWISLLNQFCVCNSHN